MAKHVLPVAVRSTLNGAAFDVKKSSMPISAKKNFIQRKPTFFKANSRVETAKGLDMKNMKAIVGFIPKTGTDKSVDDLEQQEHGGDIGGRAFIPLAAARTSGSWNKTVRNKMRISDVKKKVVDINDTTGANDKVKYIKSAMHAGKGGFVLGSEKDGKRSLMHIRSIVRKGKNTIVSSKAVFSVKGGRKVTPPTTHFMEKASLQSAGKLEDIFIKEANRQISKVK